MVKKGSSTGFLPSSLNKIHVEMKREAKKVLVEELEKFFLALSNATSTKILSNIISSLLTLEGTARRIA